MGGGGGKSRNKGQEEKKGGDGITHLTRNLVCSQVIYTKRLSERKLCQNKFNSKSLFFFFNKLNINDYYPTILSLIPVLTINSGEDLHLSTTNYKKENGSI